MTPSRTPRSRSRWRSCPFVASSPCRTSPRSSALWRYFRRQRFDFVQTHTPKASFLGLPAARLSGTTAIYTIHGALYFRDNSRLANVMGWLFERWCCAWADLVLVQSREDLNGSCPGRGCVGATKLRFVGNGVMLDRFTAPAGAGAAARRVPSC